MANIDYKEKILGVVTTNKKKVIEVTHLTIRQSIFFLHLRIVFLEVIAAICIIAFHVFLFTAQSRDLVDEASVRFNIPLFILLVIIKLVILIFIIVRWLNEYYEITPSEIIYRRGVIVKREDRYRLDHIGSIDIEQGLFGRIFNYGTLKLFVWTTEKEAVMYQIHNPQKYHRILQELQPETEKSEKIFRHHLFEPSDDTP